MRIISGENKGMGLKSPGDRTVRPTTDRVKEALFSVIQEYIPGSVVCDLFAGTGNLGLEALSRGACRGYFGDNSKDSMVLIKQNIEKCKMYERSVLLRGDYVSALDRIIEPVDVFFLDPPYNCKMIEPTICAIMEKGLLSKNGIIAAEHGIDEVVDDYIGGARKIKEKQYGTVVLSFFIC